MSEITSPIIFTCARCHNPARKRTSRRNKMWGRVCAACSKELKHVMSNGGVPLNFRPKTVAPKLAPKKTGLLNRIANRLFRRRGIR